MKTIMLEEQKRLNLLINELENKLKTLPDGTLQIKNRGKYQVWYHYVNKKHTLIQKKDIALAQKLADAAFSRFRLKESKAALKAVKAYLRNADYMNSDEYLQSHPEIRKLLLQSGFTSEDATYWANIPYKKPDIEYKGTLYKTLKGEMVKSRAEKDIADALFLAGIPYRYECGISFNNGKTWYYPDFTILDPRTGNIFLWEHFGMEELDYYRHKNANKMYVYFDNGYIPGKNLICTSSSENQKLTKSQIQKIINLFFK